MPTFLDLPYELLEQILSTADVSSRNLFELSQLSPVLQRVCLELYLRLNGGRDLQQRCIARLSSDGPQIDIITALLALDLADITHIDHFECHFQRGETSLADMKREYERVGQFLSRLNSVGKVLLDFDVAQRWSDKTMPEEDIVEWCTAFGRFLDTVLERGCTALEVNGARQLVPMYESVPVNPLNLLNKIKRSVSNRGYGQDAKWAGLAPGSVLLGPTWMFKPKPYTKEIALVVPSLEVETSSKLEHLSIGSEHMLILPVLQWTYTILRTSPITHFTLHGFKMWVTAWTTIAQVLPHAVPNLKALSISNISGIGRKCLSLLIGGFSRLEFVQVERVTFAPEVIYPGYVLHTRENAIYRAPKDELTYGYPRWEHLRELRLSGEWIIPDLLLATVKRLKALQRVVIWFHQAWDLYTVLQNRLPVKKELQGLAAFLEDAATALPDKCDLYIGMDAFSWTCAWGIQVSDLWTGTHFPSWLPKITGIIFRVTTPDWRNAHLPYARDKPWMEKMNENVAQWFDIVFARVQRVLVEADGQGQEVVDDLKALFNSPVMRKALANMDHVDFVRTGFL